MPRKDKNRKTLQKGEFIRKSDNRYCYQYEVGKKENGRAKYATVYATTLDELRAKETEIADKIRQGINLIDSKTTTVNRLFFQGIETKERLKILRPSTRINYENMWNQDCLEFGKRNAADVTVQDVRSLIADFVEQGLSRSTIKLLHGLLIQAFDDAVSMKVRIDNPCKDVTVIRAKKNGVKASKREALTPDEQSRLMEFVKGSNTYNVYHDFLTIALSTDMRVGELTGLTWGNVDLNEGSIKVVQQLKYGKKFKGDTTHFYIDRPKTEAGNRVIYIDAETVKAFHNIKRINFALGRLQNAVTVDGVSDFVFLNRNGKPYATNAVNFVLKNIVDAYNEKNPKAQLPHISAHILRHTGATRDIEKGMHPKALQAKMGHEHIGVTMDTYANPTDEEWKRKEQLKTGNSNLKC